MNDTPFDGHGWRRTTAALWFCLGVACKVTDSNQHLREHDPADIAFSVSPSADTPIRRKVLASDSSGGLGFGSALAIHGDTLLAASSWGSTGGVDYSGAVYVLKREPETREWIESRQLVPNDIGAFDQFGHTLAADGDTLVVGAPSATIERAGQQGAVYVFTQQQAGTDDWVQTAKLVDDSGWILDRFGSSLALEGDLLAVGSNPYDDDGTVMIFDRSQAWARLVTIAEPVIDEVGSSSLPFGSSVAMQGDLLVVGAPAADVSYIGEDDGAAYVFRRDPSARDRWNYVERLEASEAVLCPGGRSLEELALESLEVQTEVARCAREDSNTDLDSFGASVSIAGDIIAVGAPDAEDPTGASAGAVYVFRADTDGVDHWQQIAKLAGRDSTATLTPRFGAALALAPDRLLVGAPGGSGVNGAPGAAYLFERDAGGPQAWGESFRFTAADGLSREQFGSAVALDGLESIIGADGYDVGAGAVYSTGGAPLQVPAFPATGSLVNDGIVEGPHGAFVGSVGDQLDEPLSVWLHEVPPPAEPVSTGVTPVGSFYNVGSVQTTTASNGLPFVIALPVPVGIDTSHLGIAVLSPPDRLANEATSFWRSFRGFYSPETSLFSIALPTLAVQGSTVVLVDDPDIAPFALPAASRALPGPEYAVECRGYADPSKCQPTDQIRINGLLRAAHDDFVRLGYDNGPYLDHTGYYTTIGNTIIAQGLPTYSNVVALDPLSPECAGILGSYRRSDKFFGVCYGGAATPDDQLNATIRHELFHAFQYAHSVFRTDSKIYTHQVEKDAFDDLMWILEGTATAAEQSGDVMRRNTFQQPPLHATYRSLVESDHTTTRSAGDIAYSAQDFWVYFGQQKSLGLGYFKELFARGATPWAAHLMLANIHGTTLADHYWKWVKNQAFEKGPYLDGALLNPCSLNLASEDDKRIVGDTVTTISFPMADAAQTVVGTLPRLTASIAEFKIVTDVADVEATVVADPPAAALQYKVYVNGESGCAGGGDGKREFGALAKDSVVYVLVANTSYKVEDRVHYTIAIQWPEP